MNIKLAQIKYRPANFKYNFEQVINFFDKTADLMIYPDFEASKSMDFDSN